MHDPREARIRAYEIWVFEWYLEVPETTPETTPAGHDAGTAGRAEGENPAGPADGTDHGTLVRFPKRRGPL